jgi:hypothetical protein
MAGIKTTSHRSKLGVCLEINDRMSCSQSGFASEDSFRALTLRVFSHETPSLSTQAPPLVPYKSTLLASDLQNASGSNLNTRPCNPAVMAVLTQMLLGFCPVRISSSWDSVLLGFRPSGSPVARQPVATIATIRQVRARSLHTFN